MSSAASGGRAVEPVTEQWEPICDEVAIGGGAGWQA